MPILIQFFYFYFFFNDGEPLQGPFEPTLIEKPLMHDSPAKTFHRVIPSLYLRTLREHALRPTIELTRVGYYLTHSYMYRNECHSKEKRKRRRNLRIKKENDLGLQEHLHQNFKLYYYVCDKG